MTFLLDGVPLDYCWGKPDCLVFIDHVYIDFDELLSHVQNLSNLRRLYDHGSHPFSDK